MFDTMTLTKIVGGFCGSLLVFLLGAWVAEGIYHVGGGHGEHQQAYVIDTGDDEADDAAEEEGPDFETLMADANASAGERLWGRCRACHALDGTDGVGPHLDGVVGRDVAAVDGYNYSGALIEAADVWTPENLFNFIDDPRGYAPGTAMNFSGLPNPEDRANLIAFLQEQG